MHTMTRRRIAVALVTLAVLAVAFPLTSTIDAQGARVNNGLLALYTFEEGSGTTVRDVSGSGDPLDLTIGNPGAVSWASGALTLNSPALIASNGAATKIIDSVRATNALTVEAWIAPANTTQDGPARVVSISGDPQNRNFTLGQGQWNDRPSTVFGMRLRSTATNNNGEPDLFTPEGSASTGATHVLYTRDAGGTARLYVNGAEVSSGSTGGDLSNWNTGYPLVLGNELSGDRPWLGQFYLVAVYNRALDAGEVTQNFNAG
jgi:hypothetical protein